MKTAKLLETKKLENTIIVDNKVRFMFNYSQFTWTKEQAQTLLDDLILVLGQLEDEKPEEKPDEPINLDNIPY